MESIKQVLMHRDGMTADEAEDEINEAKETLQLYLQDGDTSSAYDICQEYFGLEPNYLHELH